MEVTGVGADAKTIRVVRTNSESDRFRVKRKTLETVLQQCQRALELINSAGCTEEDDEDDVGDAGRDVVEENDETSSTPSPDAETEELCDLLKSRVDSPDFLQKLENAQASVPQNIAGMLSKTEECSSWDMVNDSDLWESGDPELDNEDYVLVRQEDIVDGIACFMAAYLLSLKQTKDLTPNQLQDALSKTFSVKKKKGKLRKAWDGSKIIYNVASWGATAVGIYQNPAILRAASAAFWTSCHVISKLF